MKNSDNPNILILEDDHDQMALLVDFAVSEIRKFINDENINDQQRQQIKKTRIIKVNDINSLQKAVSVHRNVIMAILDCNTPDIKGRAAHDQLVKTNHIVTGQHKAVDIVTKHLPGTTITMTSSMDRFQRIINKYYESKHNLSINFIRKSNPSKLKRNIEQSLREYLEGFS